MMGSVINLLNSLGHEGQVQDLPIHLESRSWELPALFVPVELRGALI